MRLPTRLSQRRVNSHKKDFGHVFVIAGSPQYSGAAVLCAEAALHSGSGLVTLGIPKSLNSAIIKIKPKEVMTLPLPETMNGVLGASSYKKIEEFIKHADILAIGPGLGLDGSTKALIRKVIINTAKPLVIDADGLNALTDHLDILRIPEPVSRIPILTPHPGEMSRLTGINAKKIQQQRKNIAKSFSKGYNCITVLKGYQTVVADPKEKVYINKTGNPGMATAGSGDVLTGIIASFLGQGLEPFDAAKYGVYIHGLAGDLAAKEKTQICLIASDIIDKIPDAVKRNS